MRCLYLVAHDPISPNSAGGASAMYYDQLLALADLGHEIHLWHFASADGRRRFHSSVASEPAVWPSIQRHCTSIRLSEYRDGESLIDRGLRRLRSLLPPRLPVPRWRLHQELRQFIKRIHPEIIWAQHFEPALLAAQHLHVPGVYVHHDWLYRIKALRGSRPIDPRQKAMEERLVQSVSAVVTGSAVERAEIAACRGDGVEYIPVSYESVSLPLEMSARDKRPTLIHLGTMNATANREGLLAFFQRVWPKLRALKLHLKIVGDLAGAPPALREYLGQASCAGFVPDLGTVLFPFDLHIVPWIHATGQRTRVPLAFNYAQVLVAVRAGVACYPEAQDGVNCRLVHELDEMPGVIAELAVDTEQRLRLGTAAKRTFEASFTRRALLPRYASVLAHARQFEPRPVPKSAGVEEQISIA